MNQTVWVDEKQYLSLARQGMHVGSSFFIDANETRWEYEKTVKAVEPSKSIRLFYNPLKVSGNNLFHGLVVRNCADVDVNYTLNLVANHYETFNTRTVTASEQYSAGSSSIGQLLLVQKEPVNGYAIPELKKDDRVVSAVRLKLSPELPSYWKGLIDGFVSQLPKVAVATTLTVMVSILPVGRYTFIPRILLGIGEKYSYGDIPLSFNEFLSFRNMRIESLSEELVLNLLREYLEFSGLPEIVLSEKSRKFLILDEYFRTFLTRDVFEGYGVRSRSAMVDLIRLLLNSTYMTISRSFENLKSIGHRIGKETVAKYLHYLESSFFVSFIEIISPKIRKSIRVPKKVMVVDNFFIKRFSSRFSENMSRLMENAVFLQIRRMMKNNPMLEAFYWRNYQQNEVDFAERMVEH
ncbi:MAG: ATP-binding protein [Thermoproteota archaeon]